MWTLDEQRRDFEGDYVLRYRDWQCLFGGNVVYWPLVQPKMSNTMRLDWPSIGEQIQRTLKLNMIDFTFNGDNTMIANVQPLLVYLFLFLHMASHALQTLKAQECLEQSVGLGAEICMETFPNNTHHTKLDQTILPHTMQCNHACIHVKTGCCPGVL